MFEQLTRKPKISAGIVFSPENHSTIGRNLNARHEAALPHCHRFPGFGQSCRKTTREPIAAEIAGGLRQSEGPLRGGGSAFR